MKLLLAHNRYRYAGGEDEVFRREGELLRSAGHEVLEYTRHNEEIVEDGTLSKAKLGVQTLWAWDSRRELRAILRRERPHVVHFHNTFPLISPAAYYACQEAGIPVVQSLHNARFMCPGAIFYREGRVCQDCLGRAVSWPGVVHSCYRNSPLRTAAVAAMLTLHRILGTWQEAVDAYIVFTEFYRRKFIAAGLPPEKIFVKPHFLFDDPGVKQEQSDYVLYVGRLAPEKGVHTLLQAWKLQGNPPPLRIVGDGPARQALEARKEQACLSSVHFEGSLPPQHLGSIMKRAAFLIFPSECYEAFGLTIVEAFACGVPVLASGLETMTEIVEDGKTGLHFTPGDAQDLAAKVEWAWAHPREMAAMGNLARAEYQAKYTAGQNYQLLMKIYNQAQRARA
ncbi:MAG: glycosyl transferase family 1 [Acidobacteria bacterium]|nr:MAG: glycosyl transferase family 1 [Acidobacteriota bacterium]